MTWRDIILSEKGMDLTKFYRGDPVHLSDGREGIVLWSADAETEVLLSPWRTHRAPTASLRHHPA